MSDETKVYRVEVERTEYAVIYVLADSASEAERAACACYDGDFDADGCGDVTADAKLCDDDTREPDYVAVDGILSTHVPPPPPFTPPPEDAWVTINGHRWASEGSVLLREDCPLLTGWISGRQWWIAPPFEPARKMIEAKRTNVAISVALCFAPEFAPVLGAGVVEAHAQDARMAAVWRDDELIAVVMSEREATHA